MKSRCVLSFKFRIVYKIVETSQAPVPIPENTDDNLTPHHLEPMMQQEINDIGKFSTTSEKFGSFANKLPVGQKYHLIKSHFVPPINYKFPTRFLHQSRRGFQHHSDTKEPTCGINYRMSTEKRTLTNCSRNRYQIRIWLAATCRNHMPIYFKTF